MDLNFLEPFLPDLSAFARMSVATAGGLILGLDREVRGKAAGIRTHALVSLSSAVITISALMLYSQLTAERSTDIDPLRVIQGLAQAIGFIAAGTIITARGDVRNLTSAANIWLAAALGIAAGAGQFGLVAIVIFFGVLILTVVRVVESFIPGGDKAQAE